MIRLGFLLGCLLPALACAAEALPLVYLNHCFITLDKETYLALRDSPAIKALGYAEERRVAADKDSWTGFYLRGHHTYLEFFAPDGISGGARRDDSGIAFGVEEAGGVEKLTVRLRPIFGATINTSTRMQQTPDGPRPWFKWVSIYPEEGQRALEIWTMEMMPSYLAATQPKSTAPPLARASHLATKFAPDRPLEDVVGLTVALAESARHDLWEHVKLFGWHVTETSGTWQAEGPDIRLTVLPARERSGICAVELRLRRGGPPQTVPIGSATLELAGETGRFTFWRPEPIP